MLNFARKIMLDRTLKALEYDKILAAIALHATSSSAKESILEEKPSSDKEVVETKLEEVAEAYKALFEYSVKPPFNFDSVGTALDRAGVMSVLSMSELLKIAAVLRLSRTAKLTIEKIPDDNVVLLKKIASGIFTDKPLEDDIESAILSETEMSDNASEELRRIRIKIRKIGESIKAKLYNFVHSAAYAKYVQDGIVTIRNDRYVIPLKAEYRKEIPGLVHNQSASGATLYVEPMVIVELNNDLKTLLLEEEKEINRILRDFTARVAGVVDMIKYDFSILIRLDVIFAKAEYANEIKAVKPIINDSGYTKITKGRHPLIDKTKVVPTNIEIGKDFDMLLITGPNTGGKTVSLKLVGLFALMAASGIFLPAQDAEVGLYDNIYCDIGDEQSIEQSLSTFSSHIKNIVGVLDNIKLRDLLLFDELGAGTDPAEGAALALAVCDFIKESGAKAIITTHYNELKEYGVVTDRVINGSMDFDPVSCRPTYKLNIGTPGASNALLIAERLGLNKSIIDKAREGLKSQKVQFENVLAALEIARKNAELNEQETESDKEEAKKIRLEVEKERNRLIEERKKIDEIVRKEKKKMIEDAVSEANDIIEELRNILDDPSEKNLFRARELRSKLKKYTIDEESEVAEILEDLGDPRVGDDVFCTKLGVDGRVMSLNPIKGTAVVSLGNFSSTVNIKDIKKIAKKQEKKIISSGRKLPRTEAVSTEIKVMGLTVEDAIVEVDKFISTALLAGLHEVKIIHGTGTGALRKALQAHLRGLKEVDSVRDGVYGEGERGVTFATFK